MDVATVVAEGVLPAWQGSLLCDAEPGFDARMTGLLRHELSDGAWVDHLPGWLAGADRVFSEVAERGAWRSESMEMYGEIVDQPRKRWYVPIPELRGSLAVLREAGDVLSRRYGVAFEHVGCNLYRDGRDSVAWHGDRIARDRGTAVIAILSLGHARAFKLRPRGGGASLGFTLGRGDLLVMGGTCQRTWQHTVPKVRVAGPRISVTYRHEYGPRGSHG